MRDDDGSTTCASSQREPVALRPTLGAAAAELFQTSGTTENKGAARRRPDMLASLDNAPATLRDAASIEPSSEAGRSREIGQVSGLGRAFGRRRSGRRPLSYAASIASALALLLLWAPAGGGQAQAQGAPPQNSAGAGETGRGAANADAATSDTRTNPAGPESASETQESDEGDSVDEAPKEHREAIEDSDIDGDGPLPFVRDVEMRGNKALDSGDILEGLDTQGTSGWWLWREDHRLDTVALARDRDRIHAFYLQQGYFSAVVTDVDIRDAGERDGKPFVDVIFSVDEGKPSKLSDLRIEGAPEKPEGELADELRGRPSLEPEALEKELALPRDEAFMYEDYEDSLKKLSQLLQSAGYPHVEVRGKVAVDREARRVGILYGLAPGPLVRYGETEVTGLERLPVSVVRNRIAWQPGQIYDPRQVTETRQRLQALRRFQSVRVELAGDTPSEVEDIKITAVEAPPREVRLGFGVGIDQARWEIRGRAGYRVFGFPDALSTFSTELRPAFANLRKVEDSGEFVGEASMALEREDLFIPLLHGITRVAYTDETYEAYSSRGGHFRVGLDRNFLGNYLRVGVSWQMQLLQFPSIELNYGDPMSEPGMTRAHLLGLDRDLYRLAMFEQVIAYDRRDNPLDAKEGFYAELRTRQAGGYSGSAFSFITVTPELRGYLPVLDRLILAARVRYGRLLSGPELPITERFFSGGASNHRGFPQRRLSPWLPEDPVVGEDGPVAFGGQALLETSVEARFDMFTLADQWVGIVGFLDGGDVTALADELQPLNPSSLFWAAGAGLRYDTPVGPVRVDLGYRLNRYGESPLVSDDSVWDRMAFHLSIGEAF